VRAFVAILLDAATRAALGAEIGRLQAAAPRVAWVDPAGLHVTLKFLGEVGDARTAEIGAALAGAAAGASPFELEIRGLGAFPTLARPRVVWAGAAAGREACVDLAGRVEAALGPLGFAPEARPFSPHVTLGRIREPRRDATLAALLARGVATAFGRVRIASLSLMKSELSPRGARYTEVAAVRL
jgi:2'-5' RNA ligase